MGGNRSSEKQIFSKDHLIAILDSTIDKTLGELDVKDVFRIARDNPKVKGIAGMVIEQSVLGYDADPKQDCDILVDGVEVEVKSTGIILEKNGKHEEFAAKEPMSITAVSPDCIVGETFLESHFGVNSSILCSSITSIPVLVKISRLMNTLNSRSRVMSSTHSPLIGEHPQERLVIDTGVCACSEIPRCQGDRDPS